MFALFHRAPQVSNLAGVATLLIDGLDIVVRQHYMAAILAATGDIAMPAKGLLHGVRCAGGVRCDSSPPAFVQYEKHPCGTQSATSGCVRAASDSVVEGTPSSVSSVRSVTLQWCNEHF